MKFIMYTTQLYFNSSIDIVISRRTFSPQTPCDTIAIIMRRGAPYLTVRVKLSK